MASDRDDRWGADDPRDDFRRPPPREVAKSKVKGPAIAMIVVAVLQLLGSIYNVISLPTMGAQFEEQRKQIDNDPNMPAAQKQQMKDWMKMYEDAVTPAMPVSIGLGVITAILILVGAVKMMNLSSRGWARLAAILTVIPCFVCCLWGIPIGIWALSVLSNPDVKDAFASAGGRRDDRDEGWTEADRR